MRGWKVAGYVLESPPDPLPYLLDIRGGKHILSIMAHISKSFLPTYGRFSRGRSHIDEEREIGQSRSQTLARKRRRVLTGCVVHNKFFPHCNRSVNGLLYTYPEIFCCVVVVATPRSWQNQSDSLIAYDIINT